MITIGLTGGIACGKSTVSRCLTSLNIPVLDADIVARDIVQVGSEALKEIQECFGAHFLLQDGSLDRIAMRHEIITNPKSKTLLEGITHPKIFQAIHLWQQQQSSNPTCVVEAALMVETGSYKMYDAIIVVACEENIQQQRLMERNQIDATTAQKWMASQMPMREKMAIADWVIHNNQDQLTLEEYVKKNWDAFLTGLQKKRN